MSVIWRCAVIGGIVLSCLNVGWANEEFVILGDASGLSETQPVVQTAFQEPSPAPAADEGAHEEMAPPPPGAGDPYGYMGPTPAGPVVIEEGWGDVWTQTCGPWCSLGAIIVGVEGTFLAPLDEPTQSVLFTDLTDGSQYRGTSDPGFGAGMRTTLGLQQCGTGARVRYWFFGNDHVDFDPDGHPKAHPVFAESYYLRATTVDAELFHEFCFPHGTLEASFGARYARLRRGGAVTGVGEVGHIDLLGVATGYNELEGTGMTFSIGGRKPLHRLRRNDCAPRNGCCPPPCLNFFWSARGSYLWADTSVSVLTDANANAKAPFGTASASSRDKAFIASDECENVFITDIQLGLEYNFGFCCVPGIFSLRGGVEYQHWDTGDLLAQSSSFAFLQDAGQPPNFGGRTDASSDGNDGDLDLLGFFVGLQWKF